MPETSVYVRVGGDWSSHKTRATYYKWRLRMVAQVTPAQGEQAVTYNNVVGVSMTENTLNIIQDTGTIRATQSFEVFYSVTITK